MPKNVTVHCSDGIVAPFSESVKVPEEVVSISFMTFYCDKKVKEVTLPSTLEEICDGAFMDSSVVAIVIPESVQRIAEKAFESSSLKRLFLPKTLPQLESRAFAFCNFEEVIYAGTKEEWEKNYGWNCYEGG